MMKLFAHSSLFVAVAAFLAASSSSTSAVRSESSSCIVNSHQDCISVNTEGSSCQCPCLPKCCRAGYALSLVVEKDQHHHHGVSCVPIDAASGTAEKLLPLPQVPLSGSLKNQSFVDHRFYGGVLPSCHGIQAGADWKYEVHHDFRLNADSREQYFLEVFSNDTSHKIYSNFDNHAERFVTEELVKGLTIVKPLMFFCFDNLAGGNQSTVALTCPKVESLPRISKCCPLDREIDHDGKCSGTKEHHWSVPLNGYLFKHHDLLSRGQLAYDNSTSLENFPRRCESKGLKSFVIHDNFHIGADGKLYFTDVHNLTLEAHADFCVDKLQSDIDDNSEEAVEDEYNYDYYSGGASLNESTSIFISDHDSYPISCHLSHTNLVTLRMVYCASSLTYVAKCCGQGENINVRGRSCTDHLAANRSFHVNPSFFEEPHTVADGVHYNSIFSMNKEFLSVSNAEFRLRNDVLIYRNREISKENFCVDYSVEYCEGNPVPELRAIINDEALLEAKMTSVFGNSLQDGPKTRIFKQCGYIISIFFLLITLALHLVVEDFRKELGGKMVIGIGFSLVFVYLCLLIRTFEPESVGGMSKSNSYCIFLALATYFFTLSTLGWMSAMSHNIMTTFGGRGSTSMRFATRSSSKALVKYSSFSFGVPALLTILVGVLNHIDKSIDPLNGNLSGTASPSWRPGFGEETCWFSSCANGSLLYLYVPMIIVLLSNVGMFTYAAWILHRLQKTSANASSSNRRNPEKKDAVKAESLHRQFSKQLSVTAMSKSLQKQKANVERFSMFLKLFSAMGLTWVFEVLAWLVSKYDEDGSIPWGIQIIVNLSNVLQGIVLFCVFALKGSTRSKVRQKSLRSSSTRKKSSRESSSAVVLVSAAKSCNAANSSHNNASMKAKKSVSYSRVTSTSEAISTEFTHDISLARSLTADTTDF